MNKEETKKCIAVMQHYVNGGEVRWNTGRSSSGDSPNWNWLDCNYHIDKTAPKKVKLLAGSRVGFKGEESLSFSSGCKRVCPQEVKK